MKKRSTINHRTILAIFTFLVLILLMLLQVGWIFRAARLEEQNFNHRVSMALKCVKIELSERAPNCEEMSDFLCGRKSSETVHKKKYWEVDSIIRAGLNTQDIDLPFSFEVTDSLMHYSKGRLFALGSYTQKLNGLTDQSGFRIKVDFPTRNQFLFAQIWGQMGLSLLFILFLTFSFFTMMRLFKREKALLMHTTDFINNMVHEFQTPIANVKFATNLIKKQKSNRTKTHEYTEVILEETQRLQNHVEEILRVGCSREGDEESDILNMHDLIAEVIQTFKNRISHSKAVIKLKAEATWPYIKGEQGPLSLAISNLIDNALKYVKKQPEIEITTQNKGESLIVKVRDNGIGIKKEDQERIFDNFFRVSTGNVHNVKGFGMGLTYAKKVTQQCGGKMAIESTPGKGSTFILTFPVSNHHEESN